MDDDRSLNERFEQWAVEHPWPGSLVAVLPASVAWGLAGPIAAVVVFVVFATAFLVLAYKAKREVDDSPS